MYNFTEMVLAHKVSHYCVRLLTECTTVRPNLAVISKDCDHLVVTALIIVSITKYLIVIGSSCAYLIIGN